MKQKKKTMKRNIKIKNKKKKDRKIQAWRLIHKSIELFSFYIYIFYK